MIQRGEALAKVDQFYGGQRDPMRLDVTQAMVQPKVGFTERTGVQRGLGGTRSCLDRVEKPRADSSPLQVGDHREASDREDVAEDPRRDRADHARPDQRHAPAVRREFCLQLVEGLGECGGFDRVVEMSLLDEGRPLEGEHLSRIGQDDGTDPEIIEHLFTIGVARRRGLLLGALAGYPRSAIFRKGIDLELEVTD